MRIDPYQTKVCEMYRVDRMTRDLQRANIENPLPPLTTNMGHTVKGASVVPPKDDYHDVGGFTQCLNIGQANKPHWVVDGRAFMRWDQRNDSYRLTAENDYAFQCARMALTQVAGANGSTAFFRLGDVPVKTFVRWVTLGIAQRFNLAMEDQIRLAVICAYYYHTQLTRELRLDADDRARLANQVSRVTAVPTPQVLEIIEPVGALTDGPALATALSDHGGSVRLKNIKYTDLYLLLAASWVGVNARENVGVALEHIPTFIAIVYTALGDRSYRKTLLARRAETAGRQQDLKQFVDQTYRLIESRFG